MECCSRCAAATPGAQTATTSQAPKAAAERPSPAATDTHLPQFSDRQTAADRLPAPRSAPARRRPPRAKIAQRTIPHDLRPLSLRDELVELGGLFRTYQQRDEPDLALLADLHERKAQAFTTWSDVSGITSLGLEARRAEQAAAAARLQHQQRTGTIVGNDGPTVARLLTAASQWEHVRSVLTYVATHAPLPGPDARLLVLMLTLRSAHTGTSNLVGQDVTALGLTDPQDLVGKLTSCGWLVLPGTAAALLASRPENPTTITVPSLAPHTDGTGPFTFGKKVRSKLSGWAQKIIADKTLRKTKVTAGTRLLALTLATQTDPAGHFGPDGRGISLQYLTTQVPVATGELKHLIDQLHAADWLTDATLTDTRLTGQLTDRVLPLSCPVPTSELLRRSE